MRTCIAIGFALLASASSVVATDPARLATRIDSHIEKRWTDEGVRPAVQANDATFARRAYLDLAGRIPTVAEIREFLESKAADKRPKLIFRLVDSPAHARQRALFWRREWIPQLDSAQFALLADSAESWLRGQFEDGKPLDQIVFQLLTAEQVKTSRHSPTEFLAAGEFKPENLAANTARAFLGINLDCAQCHNHPFARWTRDQFWETAAFFVRVPEGGKAYEITIPGSKKTVTPRLLTEETLNWPKDPDQNSGSKLLAQWVTRGKNPYFARNAVNRVWAGMLGTGLVEPLDDMSEENPASHPELLDELAQAFAESGFDMNYLTKAIALSRTYQLSCIQPKLGSSNPRLFARSMVRGLTGEQLYDSMRVAAGLPALRADLDSSEVIQARRTFVDKYRVGRTGTAQRSILQALSLLNGKLTSDLTDPKTSPTVQAVAGSPFLDARGKIDSLYLATLGRAPTEEEARSLLNHLKQEDETRGLSDLFWALLNSSEFNTNH